MLTLLPASYRPSSLSTSDTILFVISHKTAEGQAGGQPFRSGGSTAPACGGKNWMKKRPADQPTSGDGAHVDEPAGDRDLIDLSAPDELPPVLAGHQTPEIRARAAPAPIPSAPTGAMSCASSTSSASRGRRMPSGCSSPRSPTFMAGATP